MGLNRIANGDNIAIAIPAGGCSSGGQMVGTVATPGLPVLIGGDLVGVPEGSYGAGAAGNVTIWLEGAFGNQLLKTGDTPSVGDKLYLDTGDGYLTTTVGSNVWAGWCYSAPTIVGANTVVGLLLKKG